MKPILTRTAAALVATLALTCAGPALGRESTSAAKAKSYNGTVIGVDQNNHNVTVRALVTTRNFNVGDGCKIAFEDKSHASLADLAEGQKVSLCYYRTHGVNVASEINQHNRMVKGYITALNPDKRTISVRHAGSTRDFTLADDAGVLVESGKSGSLSDLKLGETVTVIYLSDNDPLKASRIEQDSQKFTGTIRALDSRAHTVTLKSAFTEKQFRLASGCKIVVNDKLDGNMTDLRIGDRLSVAYENANGVLVANRIGRETPTAETPATASRDSFP